MSKLIFKIRKELKQNIDLEHKKGSINFFKEDIKVYGVRSSIVRKISRKHLDKNLNKNQIFSLSEELLKNRSNEESTIAFDWVYRLKNDYQRKDFAVFESWLKKYVDNWGKCDDFCTHAFGALLLKFPEFLPRLNIWTKSKNGWLRRASTVILIHTIKRKKYLSKVFEIADILLLDQDDLVQKGYGWMLKETSNIYQKQVFNYVMKNKYKMPRTALRYAIEKMPRGLKLKAMKK